MASAIQDHQALLHDQQFLSAHAESAISLPLTLLGSQNSVDTISSDDAKDDQEILVYTSKRSLRTWLRLWRFEICVMFLSCAALLAIAAVLFTFDQEPLSSWNAALRPNTVIAMLSTVSKSALLMVVGSGIGQLKWVYFEQRPHSVADFNIFDEASRGPLGASKFLLRINWRAAMASVGAPGTLLAFAMDPFVQQVVSYDVVLLDSKNMVSTISTARAYDTGQGQLSISAEAVSDEGNVAYIGGGTRFGTTDVRVTGAIYKAVFGKLQGPPVTCATGDCSWESFESLGLKTLPQGAELPSKNSCLEKYTPFDAGQDGSTLWNASVALRQNNITISAVEIPSCEGSPEGFCSTPLRPQSAYECSMYWCVRTYKSTLVSNGSLIDHASKSEPFVAMDTLCNNPYFRETMWESNSGPITGKKSTAEKFTIPFFRLQDIPHYSCPNSTSLVKDIDAFRQQMAESPESFWFNLDSLNWVHSAIAATFSKGFWNAMSWEFKEDDFGMAIRQGIYIAHREGRFTQVVEQIATALTDHIRAGTNSTVVNGTVHHADTIINVHWPWMTLPTGLVLFTLIFFASTVQFSAEKSRAVWKFSALASLFHGLGGWGKDHLGEDNLKDMAKRADFMQAHLEAGTNGVLRLMKAD